jgi:LmbE family N-acetylglucosaminyl deacetylase
VTALVLVAHPDDAELAMGGSIAWLCGSGVEVVVSCFTTSERTADTRRRRRSACEKAADVLGHRVSWVCDGAYDQVDEIRESTLVGMVDAEFARWDPAVVFTHWEQDSHVDHARLARSVLAASRRAPTCTLVQFGPADHRTPVYPTFVPNTYVEIGAEHLARQVDALGYYVAAGMSVRPLDLDAVAVRARARGMEVGCDLAEPFRLVRQTISAVGNRHGWAAVGGRVGDRVGER